MKTFKNIFIASMLLSTMLFVGCSKEENETSKITYLPDIKLKGDNMVIVQLDGNYTEQGVDATINGVPVEYATQGTVNVNEIGVYVLKYLATNIDGFSSSVERTVIVAEPFIPGSADLSGNYKRAANGRDSKVTKIVDGVYSISDAWGSASSGGLPLPVPAYLFCPDGVTITMPQVVTVFGRMEGDGTFNGQQMSINTVLLDQGPFARVNVWVKQ